MPVYHPPPETWGLIDIALRDAALAEGYPWNADLNAATGEGVSCYPINSRGLKRVSTNEAFLEPVRARPNLHIASAAVVDRVLFAGGRATGVRVALAGAPPVDIMSRDIVLSAAAQPASELDALLLAEAADAQHAAGTCRMSAFEEPYGVTSPDGTVKGIAGLRVADAAIMPSDCRANTHSPA